VPIFVDRGAPLHYLVRHCRRSAHEHRTKPPTAAHGGCCLSVQRRGEGRKGAGLLHAHLTPDQPTAWASAGSSAWGRARADGGDAAPHNAGSAAIGAGARPSMFPRERIWKGVQPTFRPKTRMELE
jgi:hypothetical protein